ncbi:MAG: cell division protein FtsQ/DivIB [Flavobacteriales bacterium]|jgi:cell division protein FtsQ|tara:strand:- start:3620 stop:4327 length:708 start_codon:yes stop_codon:yes gene_type:complete
MRKNLFKILILILLVGFLTAFSFVKNENRNIDFEHVNFINSDLKFISLDSVNKMLKQSDLLSNEFLKSDLNLKDIEKKILDNAFINFAEVSLGLDGQLGITLKEKDPVFRVLNGNYYIDSEGNKMPLSNIFSQRIPLVLSNVDSAYFNKLGLIGNYVKNSMFLSKHISALKFVEKNLVFYVNGFSYSIKIKGFDNYKSKFKNYEIFFKSVYNEGLLDSINSINLNFKNQVIVQKI